MGVVQPSALGAIPCFLVGPCLSTAHIAHGIVRGVQVQGPAAAMGCRAFREGFPAGAQPLVTLAATVAWPRTFMGQPQMPCKTMASPLLGRQDRYPGH